MYSVLLMLAVGNGAATPGFDAGSVRPEVTPYSDHGHNVYRHWRRHGCYGGGCYGGYYGGCYGSSYGGGCSGGCYGSSYGGGCSGGYYGGYSCGGGMTYGYYGNGYYQTYPSGYTGSSYYGTPRTIPMPREGRYDEGRGYERRSDQERGTRDSNLPPPADRGTTNLGGTRPRTERPEEFGAIGNQTMAPAVIVVRLPADAALTVDDQPTTSTSDVRMFVSPPTERGKEFEYTLKAEIDRNGQKRSTTKQVIVRGGEQTTVTLQFPTANVAPK